MSWLVPMAAVLAAVAMAAPVQSQEAAELKVGDPAPAFKLKGTDGKIYTLEQFKGKSAIVIAWYPRALTGG